jgi:hypothetical protein
VALLFFAFLHLQQFVGWLIVLPAEDYEAFWTAPLGAGLSLVGMMRIAGLLLAGYVIFDLLLFFRNAPGRRATRILTLAGACAFLIGFQLVLLSIEAAADRWGAARNVPAHRLCLADPDPEVQEKAIRSLGAYGARGRDAVTDLLPFLSHERRTLRRAAVWTLGRIGPEAKEAVPDLTKALEDSGEIRRAARWALDQIGGPPR